MNKFSSLFLANFIVILGMVLSNTIEHFNNVNFFERTFYWFTMLAPFTFSFIFIFLFIDNIFLKYKSIKKWIFLETLILVLILLLFDNFNFSEFLKYWYYVVILIGTQCIKYLIYNRYLFTKRKEKNE